MLLDDVANSPTASVEDKEATYTLRKMAEGPRVEVLRSKEIEIFYDLTLNNLKDWDLNAIIKMASGPRKVDNNTNPNDILII